MSETNTEFSFEFSDFKNHVQFENLGAAVRHMDRIIGDWRDKPNGHIGSLVCVAMGVSVCELADIERKKRIGNA